MLMPKKVKYRKQQKGRMCGKAWRGSQISFGEFGLKALEPGWISDKQIEASRIAMTRFIKRGGKIWIRVFPDKPITKKPAETRMGKGKGAPEGWVAVVRPGKVDIVRPGVRLQPFRQHRAVLRRLLHVHRMHDVNLVGDRPRAEERRRRHDARPPRRPVHGARRRDGEVRNGDRHER